MSGFLGQITFSLAQILGLAQGAAGGAFPCLLCQLENAGLGGRVKSWIGHGDNLPVTAEELAVAFTPEQLNDWAFQAGTTPDALLAIMSEELPATISQAASPGGSQAASPGGSQAASPGGSQAASPGGPHGHGSHQP